MYFIVDSKDVDLQKLHNTFCSKKCIKETLDGKLQCNCGEETTVFDWKWQDPASPNVRMSKGGREVLFHPVYSSGTAAVKGQSPFQQNYHYYWEIKMVSKLYGTDVMVGVGTSKVELEQWQYKFCSLLGIDTESWGYSYHGSIQHNKLKRSYGGQFGVGSIIGVHLDLCNGTLEYFLNRKSLGIAFRGLKGKELYPMVCSTAAKSCIRVTCSVTKELSMQMLCLKLVMDHPSIYKTYRDIPGLSRIFEKRYFWMQPQVSKAEAEEKKRLAELDEDVTLSLVDGGYSIKKKKMRILKIISLFGDEPESPSTSGESSSSSSSSSSGNSSTSPKSKPTPKKRFHTAIPQRRGRTSSDSDPDSDAPGELLKIL